MSHNPPSRFERTDTPVRVCVRSHDPALRAALAGILDQRAEVEMTEPERAEVVLFDPGHDDEELDAQLGLLKTPALVLVSDPSRAKVALHAGARGVMLREQLGTGLVSALLAVRSGLTVLDASLATSMADAAHSRPSRPAHVEPFTAREREVIGLLAEGLSNKQIARRLDISEHTAKFHTARILAKLDADSRTEAVVRAVRYGMVAI